MSKDAGYRYFTPVGVGVCRNRPVLETVPRRESPRRVRGRSDGYPHSVRIVAGGATLLRRELGGRRGRPPIPWRLRCHARLALSVRRKTVRSLRSRLRLPSPASLRSAGRQEPAVWRADSCVRSSGRFGRLIPNRLADFQRASTVGPVRRRLREWSERRVSETRSVSQSKHCSERSERSAQRVVTGRATEEHALPSIAEPPVPLNERGLWWRCCCHRKS